MQSDCFECGGPAQHDHHVVPVSRGGTKTVPLCEACHAKAHHADGWVGKSALVKSVLQAKIQRGERTGTIPYGFKLSKDGVHLEPCSLEQENVERVHELHRQGLGLTQICRHMTAEGRKNRRGGSFSLEATRGILRQVRSVPSRKKLSEAALAEIRSLIQRGESRATVARKYGVTKDHISRIYRGVARGKGYQPPMMTRKAATSAVIQRMRQMKIEGFSQRQIAVLTGFSEGTVSAHLRSKTAISKKT